MATLSPSTPVRARPASDRSRLIEERVQGQDDQQPLASVRQGAQEAVPEKTTRDRLECVRDEVDDVTHPINQETEVPRSLPKQHDDGGRLSW